MIKHGRIALRHPREPDIGFIERAMSDPIARGDFTPSRMQSPHDVRKRFNETGYSSEDYELLLICNESDVVIGQVIHFIARRYSSARELGWMIYDPENRSRGYASEAVAALVDYLFRSYPINRLECSAYAGNPASVRVAEKCGFVRGATLRGLVFVDGRYLDGELYSLLRSDWERARGNAKR